MKLSFSTNGWQGISWNEFVALAKDAGFHGIELHDPADPVFRGPDGPLAGRANNAAARQLFREGLQIPCVDSVCDLADASAMERNVEEIVATPGLDGRLATPLAGLLYHAGHLANRTRSAERLAAMLEDETGRKVEIIEFAGAWQRLPTAERTRLGGAYALLGVDAAEGADQLGQQAAHIEVAKSQLQRSAA